ncbi:MAG: hypothetical protein K8I30_20025, partial [Anaerolineae bacterium]|nr:hypothetical protein [Anaerolineae bacterium]
LSCCSAAWATKTTTAVPDLPRKIQREAGKTADERNLTEHKPITTELNRLSGRIKIGLLGVEPAGCFKFIEAGSKRGRYAIQVTRI